MARVPDVFRRGRVTPENERHHFPSRKDVRSTVVGVCVPLIPAVDRSDESDSISRGRAAARLAEQPAKLRRFSESKTVEVSRERFARPVKMLQIKRLKAADEDDCEGDGGDKPP